MVQSVPLLFASLGAAVAPTLFATDAMGANEDAGDVGGYGIVAASGTREEAIAVLKLGTQLGRTVARIAGEGRLKRSGGLGKRAQTYTRGERSLAGHITLGEARAALRALVLVASFPVARNHKIINLEGNAAVAGAWSKGRSTSSPLNLLLRRRAAYSLTTQILPVTPWAQTDHMPADDLSRTLDAPARA